jgi:hypothetical protein
MKLFLSSFRFSLCLEPKRKETILRWRYEDLGVRPAEPENSWRPYLKNKQKGWKLAQVVGVLA